MPRQPRLDAPGLLHHVISRGIERRRIFMDREDYADFLSRVELCLEKAPNQILAWALMPNHFHLLVRSGRGGVTNFMRRLLTGYATAFNARHKRSGYLFQNRFKSIVCQEDLYLKELVRYIHLNPYRAGIVKELKSLDRYPYTGHGILMGQRECKWQEVDGVLALFGETLVRGRATYERFVFDGKAEGERPDLMGGGLKNSHGGQWPGKTEDQESFDGRILGSSGFVRDLLKDEEKMAVSLGSTRKVGIDVVAESIAKLLGIRVEDLKRRGRWQPASDGKAMLIYAGVAYLGKTNREMAKMTGMSEPPASRARKRGEVLFEGRGLAEDIFIGN